MELSIQSPDLERLRETLAKVSTNIHHELYQVTSKVGTKAKSEIAKGVAKHIIILQKDVKKDIHLKRVKPFGVHIILEKTNRFSLKRFSPKQTTEGVSYKIKQGGGTKLAVGAFMGPNPNATSLKLYGHVWQRKGKSRLPIRKLKGPSAAGVLSKSTWRVKAIRIRLTREIRKQLIRKINYRRLKNAGTI